MVAAGPKIVVSPEQLIVHNGENATFTCRGDGLPAPIIEWYRGDTRLNSVQVSVLEKQLTLASVKLKDQGMYTCIGTNVLGSRKETVSLEVQGKLQRLSIVNKGNV